MDLKQLQYFVACAQTGSFSDVAKILYSTQPSVSKVIKSLEDTLGMQLFERLPRGIRLTVQGQKVYQLQYLQMERKHLYMESPVTVKRWEMQD